MIKLPLKVKILKLVLRDFFTFSQWFFCYYRVRLKASWYLNKYIYKKQKLYRHICGALIDMWEALMHFEWHMRWLMWPKMLFCLAIKITATFFSCWCGACQWWWGGLSLVDLSFFFFFFPSTPLKIITWLFLLLVFKLQSLL